MEIIFLLFCAVGLSAGVKNANVFKNDALVPSNYSHQGGCCESDNANEIISDLASYLYQLPRNSTCRLHSDIVIREAKTLNVRALKMIDATAKIPSGILSGNLNQYGDFDECVAAKFRVGTESIKGKYCLTTISIKFNNVRDENLLVLDDLIHSHRMFTNELNDAGHRIPKFETFNWGVCVPHSCTSVELAEGLENHFQGMSQEKALQVRVGENMCFEEGRRKFGAVNAAAVSFFLAVILLTAFATVSDSHRAKATTFARYLKCFSLKRNLSLFLETESSRDDIPLLHGARFLNAVALLLSHKQMALMFNPIANRTEMAESLGKPWSMIGRCAILYTDSFILISGLLASYSLIKELDEKGRIRFGERLVSRYARFTPNLFALIIFCTFVMEYTGSGPQWGLVVKQYADLCKRNMWQNFLYVHNFFGFENMCLTHTHQLGIDMQLFLISPLLIYALWKSPKKGTLLLLAIAAASCCLRYCVTVRQELSTLIYHGISVDRLWKTATLSYILPTHRLTVYVAGLALGYYLRRDGRKLRMAYPLKWAGWIVAVSSGLLAVFGPYQVSSREYAYNVRDSALYNAFSPILWSIFLAWAIIACENGWGGWFHEFLSWKYFAIFTRMSYAVYLTQFPVFFYGVGTQRSQTFYRGFHSLIDLPEFLIILLLSVGLTLLFDLPFQNLRRTYLQISRAEEKKGAGSHDSRCSAAAKTFARKRLRSQGY